MAEGWIKVSRSLQEHWLWKDEPYDKARAWIDLIMLANWEDKKAVCNGKIVTCKRGDVNLSLSYLAKRWNWSRPKVTRFIDLLQSDGMVKADVTTNRTVLTIVNYDKFQCLGAADVTTDITTGVQRSCITKKEKKEKNIRSYSAAKNQFNKFEQNDYDFAAIERAMQ